MKQISGSSFVNGDDDAGNFTGAVASTGDQSVKYSAWRLGSASGLSVPPLLKPTSYNFALNYNLPLVFVFPTDERIWSA